MVSTELRSRIALLYRLTDLDAGDLRFTTDFRSVYASVLGPVLGVDPKQPLGKAFPALSFL